LNAFFCKITNCKPIALCAFPLLASLGFANIGPLTESWLWFKVPFRPFVTKSPHSKSADENFLISNLSNSELGISKGSFYTYFPSKDNMLAEILDEYSENTKVFSENLASNSNSIKR